MEKEELAVSMLQYSVGGMQTVHPPAAPLPSVRPHAAFTLIELLVVVALIAILAGLTLGTLGYVQGKGARSRAEAEVAALSLAIESYRIDNGSYPLMDNPTSTSLTSAVTTSNLYAALCPTNPGAKVYFEPTPNMVTNNRFVDPWGTTYFYRTNTNGNVLVNVGSFDVFSTAGRTGAAAADIKEQIRN